MNEHLSYDDLTRPRPEEQAEIDQRQLARKAAGIPKRYLDARLANYLAKTTAQHKALRAAREYTEQFSVRHRNGSCLVLAGNVGTGKTHLGCAILHEVLRHGMKGRYTTVARCIRRIRLAYRDRSVTEEAMLAEFVQPDLLVLDEIGKQRGTEDEQQLLFEVLNDRYNDMLPSIVISNYGKDGLIKYLGEPLFDRLRERGGVFVPFDWESHR